MRRHPECALEAFDHHDVDVDHLQSFIHLVDTHAGHPNGEVQKVVDDNVTGSGRR